MRGLFGRAPAKTLITPLVFHNDKEGLEKLLVQMEALKVQYVRGEVIFGLEPTANYRKPFGVHLIRYGHKSSFRRWGGGEAESGVLS